jgi:choline-sulfatase
MKPAHPAFILSDEHNPRELGCAGHPMIRTANLDCLAANGVRFSDAYHDTDPQEVRDLAWEIWGG